MCCVGAAIGRARYNCLYHVHVGYGLWLCLQGPCLCLPVHVCVCVCVCVYCLLCYLRFLTYPKPTKAAVPDRLITPPPLPWTGHGVPYCLRMGRGWITPSVSVSVSISVGVLYGATFSTIYVVYFVYLLLILLGIPCEVDRDA
jgi:hypothetical protein